MKKNTTIFLQALVILVGIGALTFLIWEPQVEGVNAHATNFEIYFKDPFLAYAYIASIPFFVILYQAFKALGYARENKIYTPETTKALRTIKYCAISIIGFVFLGEIFLMLGNPEDPPALIFMGLLITAASGMIASAAERFKRRLQK